MRNKYVIVFLQAICFCTLLHIEPSMSFSIRTLITSGLLALGGAGQIVEGRAAPAYDDPSQLGLKDTSLQLTGHKPIIPWNVINPPVDKYREASDAAIRQESTKLQVLELTGLTKAIDDMGSYLDTEEAIKGSGLFTKPA